MILQTPARTAPFLSPALQMATPPTPLTVAVDTKDKNRQPICFYQLLLSANYSDTVTDHNELVLGALAKNSLTLSTPPPKMKAP